ncbi:MAG: hypothetical protein ACQEW5_29385, partial [Bacillota bacterium]
MRVQGETPQAIALMRLADIRVNGGISENSWNVFRKNRFYLIINKVDWNGRDETPAGNASPGETPQARSAEEAPGTARGKRVPGVDING